MGNRYAGVGVGDRSPGSSFLCSDSFFSSERSIPNHGLKIRTETCWNHRPGTEGVVIYMTQQILTQPVTKTLRGWEIRIGGLVWISEGEPNPPEVFFPRLGLKS